MTGTHQHASEQEAPERAAVAAAVADAVRAPSIFNTQPWLWHGTGSTLALFADSSRQLPVVDPQGWQVLLSCGAALHHARVSLAAQGWAVEVDRPYGGQPLARLTLRGPAEPDEQAIALRAAIARRHTDRRPYRDEPVPAPVLATLAAAAGEQGASLHRVRLDQMPMLSVAVAAAAATELANPRYRIELMQWTHRPPWSNDGVPPETAVRHTPRRVPVRDFDLLQEEGLAVPAGGDRGAAFLVLHGPGREPADWLRAGEALSAVLLRATAAGLATAIFTDVLEVEHPRELVRGLLPGGTHPYVLLRCGHALDERPLPVAPRRAVHEVFSPDAAGATEAGG